MLCKDAKLLHLYDSQIYSLCFIRCIPILTDPTLIPAILWNNRRKKYIEPEAIYHETATSTSVQPWRYGWSDPWWKWLRCIFSVTDWSTSVSFLLLNGIEGQGAASVGQSSAFISFTNIAYKVFVILQKEKHRQLVETPSQLYLTLKIAIIKTSSTCSKVNNLAQEYKANMSWRISRNINS